MKPENVVSSSFGKDEYYSDVLLHPDLIMRRAQSAQVVREALELTCLLRADEYTRYLTDYYRSGLQAFGDEWGYADIVTVLLAASRTIKPSRYLEIGVRRGRSLAAVVSQSPDVEAYAADMWVQNYGNNPNPGSDWVVEEMSRLGYSKPIHFLDGDSHQTIPQFLMQNPALTFDMITVDGDHSYKGALTDLRNVLPRLTLGGVVIFDDVSHPRLPRLSHAWRKALSEDGGILSAEFTALGYGVAVGVRHRPVGGTKLGMAQLVGRSRRKWLSRVRRKAVSVIRG